MKRKLTIISICLLAACGSAFGWGRVGHASIVRIAENHLTETTKEAISEIMDGEPLTLYASYADQFKSKMFIDGVNNHPHTFEADMNFEPFRGIDDNGRYVKNCIHFIEQYSADLVDWKAMDDSTRWVELVLIAHFVGDMHCPEHIRYNPEEMTIGYFKVNFKGEEVRYHTLWDDQFLVQRYPWSFSDIAYLFDSCSEDEIDGIVAGGPYDWGRDCARSCYTIHLVKEGDKLTAAWLNEQQPLLKSQIRNAGYRLAHLLNMTFDAKYARKHSK